MDALNLIFLVLAIASVILAITAMVFAWRVEDRSRQLNNEFIRTLASIRTESEVTRRTVDELVASAWKQLVLGRPPEAMRPSPEIEELRRKLQDLESRDLAGIVQSLIDKLDAIERIQGRIVNHLLTQVAARVAALSPDLRPFGDREYKDYELYFRGEPPVGDIAETMVSPEEMLRWASPEKQNGR